MYKKQPPVLKILFQLDNYIMYKLLWNYQSLKVENKMYKSYKNENIPKYNKHLMFCWFLNSEFDSKW